MENKSMFWRTLNTSVDDDKQSSHIEEYDNLEDSEPSLSSEPSIYFNQIKYISEITGGSGLSEITEEDFQNQITSYAETGFFEHPLLDEFIEMEERFNKIKSKYNERQNQTGEHYEELNFEDSIFEDFTISEKHLEDLVSEFEKRQKHYNTPKLFEENEKQPIQFSPKELYRRLKLFKNLQNKLLLNKEVHKLSNNRNFFLKTDSTDKISKILKRYLYTFDKSTDENIDHNGKLTIETMVKYIILAVKEERNKSNSELNEQIESLKLSI